MRPALEAAAVRVAPGIHEATGCGEHIVSSSDARLAGSDRADAVGTGGGRGADGAGHGLGRAAGAEISKCNAGAQLEGGLGRDAEVAPLLTAASTAADVVTTFVLESTFKDQINPKRQTAFPLIGAAYIAALAA